MKPISLPLPAQVKPTAQPDLREDFEDNFDKDESKKKNSKESYLVERLEKSDLTDDELIGYLTVKQLLDKIANKVYFFVRLMFRI